MTFKESSPHGDLFFKMVVVSIAFHLVLILMSMLKALIFPSKTIDWSQTSVRVDLVALPERMQTLPSPPTEKVEETAKPKENIKPAVPNKKLSLDKIKKQVRDEERQKRLQEIAQEVAEQDRKARQARVKEILVKGNAVSKGSSLTGLSKIEFDEYKGVLQAHVRKNWSLPEWLQNVNLKTTVMVQVDYRGVIIGRFIDKSSGDPRFDEFALKAVDASSPLPEPPGKLASIMQKEGIILGFPE